MVNENKLEIINGLYSLYCKIKHKDKDKNNPTSERLEEIENNLLYLTEALFTGLNDFIELINEVYPTYIQELKNLNIKPENPIIPIKTKIIKRDSSEELLEMLGGMFISGLMGDIAGVGMELEEKQISEFHSMMECL